MKMWKRRRRMKRFKGKEMKVKTPKKGANEENKGTIIRHVAKV